MAEYYYPLSIGAVVTSNFGPRWGTTHYGTDYGRNGGCANNPVYAPQSGTVIYAGPASGFGGPDPAGWVVIDHPDEAGGGVTVLGHVIREVKVGDRVTAGQRVARVNPDSRTNGGVAPHVHYEHHRYVWSPPGPERMDGHAFLKARGAKWVGTTPAPAPAKTAPAPAAKPSGLPGAPVEDWSKRFTFGKYRNPKDVSGICIHVTVNAPGTPAANVARYQISSESGSYHELNDTTGLTIVENTIDWFVWAAGPISNARHFHRSFVVRGTETREQWLKFDLMLRVAAARDAQVALDRNIPVRKISPEQLRNGERGFFGHHDTALAWGQTNHVDPGPGFPWDVYLGYVKQYQDIIKKGGDDMAAFGPDQVGALHEAKVNSAKSLEVLATIGERVELVADQLLGYPKKNGKYLLAGWDVQTVLRTAKEKLRKGEGVTLVEQMALMEERIAQLEQKAGK